MLGKNKKDISVEEIGTKEIKALAENVILNKKRIEDQKMAIHLKIEELKKKLDKPTQVKSNELNSFDINDIEKSIEPEESRSEITRKIAALMDAKDMEIYNDKMLMDSIKEYLVAIRPEIEKIDKEQWNLVTAMNKAKEEYNNAMIEIATQYNEMESQIGDMLRVANISYPRQGYEKRITPGIQWMYQIQNVTELIDALLDADPDLFKIIK